jgi:hypothetical protein
MVHENENLNAVEKPDYHVLLDWSAHPNDRRVGVIANGTITLNARVIWIRLREVVTKFVWALEAMLAVQRGEDFALSRGFCEIRPEAIPTE